MSKMFLNKIIPCFMLVSVSVIYCAPMNKHDCQKYLKKYGYMSNEIENDEGYEKSLQDFQSRFALPVTGKMDEDTIRQMEKPRCGHPDRKRITGSDKFWRKQSLTYKFNNYPYSGLSAYASRKEIRRAFQIWTNHTPLEFTENKSNEVDIEITFNIDGDGPGNTLAYAYLPEIGDIYFDNEEWTSESRRGFNLLLVAAHEIGHSLGLEHSENEESLMYPYIPNYTPNFRLHTEDISRIQDLYGKRKEMNICDLTNIDSAFFEGGIAYIIKNKYIWGIKNGKIDSEYPKRVSEKWSGSPSLLNAVYRYKDTLYLHDGKNVWKYDGEMKKVDSDEQIETSVDDGVTYGERTYMFKDSNYYRYDNMVKKSGYPKPISSYWTGIPNSIDAVYYEDSDPYKYFYFFKGNKVYKFNMENRIMLKEMSLREYLYC